MEITERVEQNAPNDAVFSWSTDGNNCGQCTSFSATPLVLAAVHVFIIMMMVMVFGLFVCYPCHPMVLYRLMKMMR